MKHNAKKDWKKIGWIELIAAGLFLLVLMLAPLCMHAQASLTNSFNVAQFPGADVGTKLTNAQNACLANTSIPCVMLIDPILAIWPQGSLPSRCSNCIWLDYRSVTFSASPFSLGALASVTDTSSNPAQSGFVRTGNNVCAVASRNAANSADVCAVQVNASNVTVIGGSGGVSLSGSAATPSLTINGGTALNTQTGSSGTVVTDTSPTIQSAVLARFQGNIGVTQGGGLKHQRFGASCTTTAAVGASCSSTETWTSAFADTNYTVQCWGSNASGVPVMLEGTKAAASISIAVVAVTAAAAQFAGVECIAFHD
ncbi:MAG TPA: hypothetical protein VFB79_07635 [Candidatus Angelobacter sp.]|nr:hypothetical protein [Candidatus Angelobacter sp.]